MVQAQLALRVDVDTRRGLDEGVPRLLEVFRAAGIRASFFVTMGPDRSGLALRRAWRPSFIRKMWRTGALRLYGVRTVLSGTLLPARPVGAGAPHVLRQIAAEGHELAPHGFDHVGWQDGVHRMPAARIREDLAAAARAFESAVGVRPEATAAPGWRSTPEALTVQEECGYRYASDVRGVAPFRPVTAAGPLKTLQVPTTMPTMDELLGAERDVPRALLGALRPGVNVFTLHAEVEGGPLLDAFRGFLREAMRVAATVRLDEVAAAAADRVATSPVTRGTVPGRSGWLAVQGEPCVTG